MDPFHQHPRALQTPVQDHRHDGNRTNLVHRPSQRHTSMATDASKRRTQSTGSTTTTGRHDTAKRFAAKRKVARPAATDAALPADDPLLPCSVFHGLRVVPPYHTSPQASAPRVTLASTTAPCLAIFSATVAVVGRTCSRNGSAPKSSSTVASQ